MKDSEKKEIYWQKIILMLIASIGSTVIGIGVFSNIVDGNNIIQIIASIMTGIMMFTFLWFVPDEHFDIEFGRSSPGRRLLDEFIEMLVLLTIAVFTFLNWFVIQFLLDLIF